MLTCQTCRRPAANASVTSCVDCGAVLHPQCALARVKFVNHRPTAADVCDNCFTKWMLGVPLLLRGVAIAEVCQLTDRRESPN